MRLQYRGVISNSKKIFSDPSLLLTGVQRSLFKMRYGSGVDVINQDWDNLIILDACRHDIFKEENNLNGELQSKVSRASHTGEFIEKNLKGRCLSDTVYVTANPNISRLDDDDFYTVENCLKDWDRKSGTVLPEDVHGRACRAYEKYSNKRLIIHFMQPHEPHLGPTAEKIQSKLAENGYYKPADVDIPELTNESIFNHRKKVETWDAVQEGVISKEEIRQAYRESLNIVMEQVEELLSYIDGKSIVTSDHGEYLGERKFPYLKKKVGHPWEFTPELRIVPWLEIESDSRRVIEKEEPIGFERLDEEVVRDRLRAFGYIPE